MPIPFTIFHFMIHSILALTSMVIVSCYKKNASVIPKSIFQKLNQNEISRNCSIYEKWVFWNTKIFFFYNNWRWISKIQCFIILRWKIANDTIGSDEVLRRQAHGIWASRNWEVLGNMVLGTIGLQNSWRGGCLSKWGLRRWQRELQQSPSRSHLVQVKNPFFSFKN